jgi:hypothetical protein
MSAHRARNAPTLRVRTPESTARLLRAHFARHNLRVFLFAAGTLLTVIAAWLLLYFFCTWLLVIAFVVLDLPRIQIPRGFGILFVVAAVCAVIYAWIDRRLTLNEAPRDEKSAGEVVAEFLLAIPRMTLAIGGTLAAWQRLVPGDFIEAATLLHRLAEERRLPMSSVRLDIPDPVVATRILFGLQLTQVIDVQRDGQEFWLKLNPLRPAALRLAHESYADA